MRVPVVFLSFVIMLYGCGGGGGGGSSFPTLPALMPAQSRNAPVVFLRDGIQVGGDVRPARNALSPAGMHDGVAVSSGRVRDGENAERVLDYLDKQKFPLITSGAITINNISLATFYGKPTVLIRESTADRYVDDIVRTIQFINTALPYGKRITISIERAPDTPEDSDSLNLIPDGQIWIGIAPQDTWPIADHVEVEVAGLQGGGNTASFIWINSTSRGVTRGKIALQRTLAHEIFHAIGMRAHFEEGYFTRSVMADNRAFWSHYPVYILSEMDREALYALYKRYSENSYYGYVEYDPNKLGPWTDVSFYLRGDLGDVSFGASSRNGLIQPWAFGPSPETQLADNRALTGSVSWSGRLLGFTAHSESLAGKADLSLNIGTLRGNIDFTNLEHWGVHAVPGAVGSGTRWNDGDLRYGVVVRGNSFVQSGGDAGEVTGMFFGPNHEGMGGVVERADMSAGFAGKR